MRLKGSKQAITPPPILDFQVVDNLVNSLMEYEQEIQQYFSRYDIRPFIVCYEDLVTAYKGTALEILNFLHVPHSHDVVLPDPTIEKQSDAWTDEMVKLYYQYSER